ncbi:uncharacterized protein An02g13950 [Aspergillus niger]|uniref:Contig An02c0460, genomic contig n=2 Tax=Aspergillus niger TaxID=5061 RepID=A2QFB5_ASPNC|nr:uncharacterized protein An02g13950 [Aspergillus niger]CAK48826.1 unnamed protein product [Aspergillus niger]
MESTGAINTETIDHRYVDVLVAGLTEDWVRKNTEIDGVVVVNSCPLSVRPKNIANPQGPARNDRKDTRRLNGKIIERGGVVGRRAKERNAKVVMYGGEESRAAPARREKVKGGGKETSREKEEGG